jgi:geranylgeranyl diphosphate synthase, type III
MNKFYILLLCLLLLIYFYKKHYGVFKKIYYISQEWIMKKIYNSFPETYFSLSELSEDNIQENLDVLSDTVLNDLLEPVMYYKNLPGKNIRKSITLSIGEKFNINQDLINFTYQFIDDLHNASLIIDDIQDNSQLRRNAPTCHLKYGIPMSIGAASLFIFKKLKEYNHQVLSIIDYDIFKKKKKEYRFLDPKVIKMHVHYLLSNKILNMIYLMNLGQQLDVYWTYQKEIPSIQEYYYMIENKTGKLFTIIIEIFYELTNNISDTEYTKYITLLNKLALFFQIRDDYINLTDPTYWKAKGFCEDFDEKKYSFILIHFYHDNTINQNQKERFFKLFNKKKLSIKKKFKLLKIMNQSNSIHYTYQYLINLQKEIQELHLPMHKLQVLPFDIKDAQLFTSLHP